MPECPPLWLLQSEALPQVKGQVRRTGTKGQLLRDNQGLIRKFGAAWPTRPLEA